MDTFFPRMCVLRAVRKALPMMSGVLLDVGCGWSPYRSVVLAQGSPVKRYLGLDLENGRYARRPDLTWDGKSIPLPDGSVDCAMATEVLEHVPEPALVLREVLRVLAPGGLLLVTVPFLWPLHDPPFDEYRFTPYALRRLLAGAGFTDIIVEAMGGWDAALAVMLGLWARRRPMRLTARRVLQRLLLPVYRALLRLDRPPASFDEPVMITGLSATARKPFAPE
jgi:SAM-dependent methyltransferase